jgi:uncharacterized protein
VTDDDKMAFAAAYCEASRSNDAQSLLAMSAPDAVVWHNFDDVEATMAHTTKTMAWLHRNVTDLAWQDINLRPTVDGFVWQALMTGVAKGGPLRVHTCVVVTLNEAGMLARLDEYLDPAATSVLRG